MHALYAMMTLRVVGFSLACGCCHGVGPVAPPRASQDESHITPDRRQHNDFKADAASRPQSVPQQISQMARSNVSVTREHVVSRQSYYWPENQLIFFIVVMAITAVELITQHASLLQQQGRLGLGSPWYVG